MMHPGFMRAGSPDASSSYSSFPSGRFALFFFPAAQGNEGRDAGLGLMQAD